MALRKLAIIHFLPIELYPPIINVIDELGSNEFYDSITVFTTVKDKTLLQFNSLNKNKVKIVTVLPDTNSNNKLFKLLYYTYFNLFVFLYLFCSRPSTVLYYETISALPAIWYKKWRKAKVKMGVHYHEYVTVQEYKQSSIFITYIHRQELKHYSIYNWVSHTNTYRMNLFQKDYENISFSNTLIFPNYPPAHWLSKVTKAQLQNKGTLRLVYVGALDMETMYIEELLDWASNSTQDIRIDLYSNHCNEKTKDFILHYSKIATLYNGIPYHQLPLVLRQYNVGLVLYKGHIPNYIYNAPNKMFEYAACGLQVWLPIEMVIDPSFFSLAEPFFKKVDFKQLTIDNIINNLQPCHLFLANNEIEKYFKSI